MSRNNKISAFIVPVMIVLFIFFFGGILIFLLPIILFFILISLLRTTNKSSSRTYYYKNYGTRDDTYKTFEDFINDFYKENNFYRSQQNNKNYYYYNDYNSNGGTYNNPFSNYQVKNEYYNILGIDKNSSKEEIRKAYLKKVNEHHPDKYSNAEESVKKFHEEKLKQINEAYDNLTKMN